MHHLMAMAMRIPDYALVAEVMLFAEGFEDAATLSRKMHKPSSSSCRRAAAERALGSPVLGLFSAGRAMRAMRAMRAV